MIATLLFTLLASKGPELGPILPPGLNSNFQAAVIGVETKLTAGDFAGASKTGALLPKQEIAVQWDDSKVPAGLRDEFKKMRDEAIASWQAITQTKINFVAEKPDIKFDFVEVLPNPPESGIPAGATYFWSDNPGDVRLETVIGLKRMSPPEDINPVNVFNEVATGIGQYYGLEVRPYPNTFMGRTDFNSQSKAAPLPVEMMTARETVQIAHDLRESIRKKERLAPTLPKAYFDPKTIDLGTALQGDTPTFNIQITNNGNSPLAIRFQPDCSCVGLDNYYQVIQPNATYVLRGAQKTEVVGPLHHSLLINTNDADQPNLVVPVSIRVNPRYRFLAPDGDTIKVPESGTSFPIYLVLAKDSDITPRDVQIAPVAGKVTMEPWSGTLPDPALNEGPMPRKGYKLTVNLDGALPVPGRNPVTIAVGTNNKIFPSLQYNFFAQRGLVVSPPRLYMGEVQPGVRKFTVVVTGPAKTFHVKKVYSSWPHLSFTQYPVGDSQINIEATYDGKGDQGPVLGDVVIETDDPDQPKLEIPINGTIH